MPRYQIQAPDGRTVTVEGDNAPTQDDATKIFSALPAKETGQIRSSTAQDYTPELLGPTPGGTEYANTEPDSTSFVKDNSRPNIPFDVNARLPAKIRARLSLEDNIDNQVDLLSKQSGIIGARKSSDGKSVIATISDENGKPKDIPLHPQGASLDLAGNAGTLGKLAVVGGLAALTDGLSLPLTAGLLGGGAAATEAGMKIGSRVAGGQPVDLPDVALSAGKEGALNAAAPLAAKAVGIGANAIRSLLSRGSGALEKNAVEAAGRLAIPITPAQATGSRALARSTTMPGTGGNVLAETQQGALKAATDRQLGLSGINAVPSEADIASKVEPIIGANAATAEAAANQAIKGAATTASNEIQDTLDKGLIPTNLNQSQIGNFIRGKVTGLRDAFKAEAGTNYSKAYDLADAENISVPTKPVTDLVSDIADKSHPATAEIVPEIRRVFGLEYALTKAPEGQGISGLFDARGNLIPAPAPTPQPVSLRQAVELRALIGDKLATGEAVGDIPGRYLKQLYGALSDSIKQGVESGSPELQQAYKAATSHYSTEIPKFQQSDVAKLFADNGAKNYVADNEIIPSIFNGRGNLDALNRYKELLGPDSPEYNLLLRGGLQHMIDQAPIGDSLVDAGGFLSKLSGLSKEMRQATLGPMEDQIVGNAKILKMADGAKIDPQDLVSALQLAPGKAAKALQEAIDKQVAFDQQYNSGIMRQLRAGTLGPRNLGANPDTFVTRFIGNASTEDVKDALGQIGARSPETVEAIRQRTLANVLKDVGTKPAVGEASTGENTAIDSAKIVKDYLSGSNRTKYEEVLGPKGVQFLDDLATMHEAIAKEALSANGAPLTQTNLAAHMAGNVIPLAHPLAKGALRVATAIPDFALGTAQRSSAVRDFLTTGQLPDLFTPATRGAILAAPEALNARQKVLSQKP